MIAINMAHAGTFDITDEISAVAIMNTSTSNFEFFPNFTRRYFNTRLDIGTFISAEAIPKDASIKNTT